VSRIAEAAPPPGSSEMTPIHIPTDPATIYAPMDPVTISVAASLVTITVTQTTYTFASPVTSTITPMIYTIASPVIAPTSMATASATNTTIPAAVPPPSLTLKGLAQN